MGFVLFIVLFLVISNYVVVADISYKSKVGYFTIVGCIFLFKALFGAF